MGKQAVISDTDTPARSDPPGYKGGDRIRPAKVKESNDAHDMEDGHPNDRVPVKPSGFGRLKFDYILH